MFLAAKPAVEPPLLTPGDENETYFALLHFSQSERDKMKILRGLSDIFARLHAEAVPRAILRLSYTLNWHASLALQAVCKTNSTCVLTEESFPPHNHNV